MKKNWDFISSIIIFIILGAFSLQLKNIPKEAKGYPTFMIVCSFILAVVLLFNSLKNNNKECKTEVIDKPIEYAKRVAIYAISIGLYIFFMEKIGFLLSTFIFMAGSLIYLKMKNKLVIVLLPLITTLAMYFFFGKFLTVMLPHGTWIQIYF